MDFNPEMMESVSFPAKVVAINPLSPRMAQVLLADGTEGRIAFNAKRGMVVPRRWRKPRVVSA